MNSGIQIKAIGFLLIMNALEYMDTRLKIDPSEELGAVLWRAAGWLNLRRNPNAQKSL